MATGQRRAIWQLGLCQCVLWGVLYYSFPVLLLPIEAELGLARTAVSGAFSVGLTAMALAAPAVGRWLDGGHAAILIRIAIGLAASGLLTVASAHGLLPLYLGWLATGVAMAALLYEAAFVLVIRAVSDPNQRLRALAAITVMGGLASTIFLPLTAISIEHWSWRGTLLACALAVLSIGVVLEWHVLPALETVRPETSWRCADRMIWPPHLRTLAAIFASTTLATMALTTLLIPMLVESGAAAPVAALVLAAFGIAQLPGRLWLPRGQEPRPGRKLTLLPIALQVAGLTCVIASTTPACVAVGVAVYGLGAGLQTLAKPWLVQTLYGRADAGRWSGEIARIQGCVRAVGPVTTAALAGFGGTTLALATVTCLLLLTLPAARRLPAH